MRLARSVVALSLAVSAVTIGCHATGEAQATGERQGTGAPSTTRPTLAIAAKRPTRDVEILRKTKPNAPPASRPVKEEPWDAAATATSQRGDMHHQRATLDADGLRDGTFQHAYFDEAADVVKINAPRADYPFVGTWTSEPIVPDKPFTELLPSWNATVPAGSGVRFEVRVSDAATGVWSPWLYIGHWGRSLGDHRTTEFDAGNVDIDTLTLTAPADAYQIRATLHDYRTDTPATKPSDAVALRRVDVVTSWDVEVKKASTRPRSGPATAPSTQRVDLGVPFRAQGVEAETIRHSICSPTSVSMLLSWAGADLPTADNALAIWDDDYALFGNWNRAVQYAGSLGYEAYLERFETMDQARLMLKAGQPIIASIRFKKGTFPSNLQKATEGHLIVLRGYDEHGDLIVNDPASKDKGNGVVYKAAELANAWLVNTGGVGYVIRKKG